MTPTPADAGAMPAADSPPPRVIVESLAGVLASVAWPQHQALVAKMTASKGGEVSWSDVLEGARLMHGCVSKAVQTGTDAAASAELAGVQFDALLTPRARAREELRRARDSGRFGVMFGKRRKTSRGVLHGATATTTVTAPAPPADQPLPPAGGCFSFHPRRPPPGDDEPRETSTPRMPSVIE